MTLLRCSHERAFLVLFQFHVDAEDDGRKMEASTRTSSLCSERKKTRRAVHSTTSEALTNYWLRKIIVNVLSLFFS